MSGVPATDAEPILIRRRGPGELEAPSPAGDVRRFHASMPGYAPTPLRAAPGCAHRLGVAEVLVKDESARLDLPSFKILGASWAVGRALARRLALDPPPSFEGLQAGVEGLRPLTLSAATDGNHGRAVARMAALFGLAARIYVPAGTTQARIDAIAGEGASVTVVDGSYDDAVRRSAADAGDRCLVISDTSWPGYEDVPRWVIEGYATIFAEIEEQLEGDRPDVVVVPIGVGALAAAVVAHFWGAPGDRPALVGVEPTSAACILESVRADGITTLGHPQDSMMAGLNCATPSLVAWPLVSRGLDVYLAAAEDRVPEAMRLLAADGIVAGETGAAALAGTLRLVADDAGADARAAAGLGPGARVLLLCTEGATDPEAYRRIVGER